MILYIYIVSRINNEWNERKHDKNRGHAGNTTRKYILPIYSIVTALGLKIDIHLVPPIMFYVT